MKWSKKNIVIKLNWNRHWSHKTRTYPLLGAHTLESYRKSTPATQKCDFERSCLPYFILKRLVAQPHHVWPIEVRTHTKKNTQIKSWIVIDQITWQVIQHWKAKENISIYSMHLHQLENLTLSKSFFSSS